MKSKILTFLFIFISFCYADEYDLIINKFNNLPIEKQCDTIAQIGWIYRNENPLLALKLSKYSIYLAEKNNLEHLLPTYYNFCGVIYRNINNLFLAEKYFIQALEKAEKYNNKKELGYAYNNIGNIFIIKGDTLYAFKYLEKAKITFLSINFDIGIAYVYQRYGQAYLALNNYNLAYSNFLEAYKYRQNTTDTFSILSSLKQIVFTLCKKKDFQTAEYYIKEFDKYTPFIQKNNFQKIEINLYIAYYLQHTDINKSIELASKSLEYFIQQKYYPNILISLELLSENYKRLKDYQKQAYFLELLKYYTDENNASAHNNYLSQQIFEYENKKYLEIIQKNNFYLKIILLSITLSLIVITILLIRIIKKKNDLKASNKKLEEMNDFILSQYYDINNVRKELEQSKELLEQLIITLAHDMKNPVAAIKSFTELTLEEIKQNNYPIKQEIFKYLEYIISASVSLYDLIENVLYWSKSLTQKIIYEPIYFNLFELFQNITNLLNIQLQLKNIKLHILIPQTQEIYGDPQLLQVVFRNIISNAIKFSKENDLITIRYFYDGLNNIIKIEDNGIGMNEEKVNELLDTLTIKSSHGTKGEKGTGFGLILIKKFVELHNGKINIESTPGKGTIFTVSLPANY